MRRSKTRSRTARALGKRRVSVAMKLVPCAQRYERAEIHFFVEAHSEFSFRGLTLSISHITVTTLFMTRATLGSTAVV